MRFANRWHFIHIQAEWWLLPKMILCPGCARIGIRRSLAGRHVDVAGKAPALLHLQLSDCAALQRLHLQIVFEDCSALFLSGFVAEGHATVSSPSALFGCTLRGLRINVGFGFTNPSATGSIFLPWPGLMPLIRSSRASSAARIAARRFSRLL